MKKVFFPLLIILVVGCSGKKEDSTSEETSSKEPNIVTKEIIYTSDSVEMTGFIAYDANLEGKRAGILVVHEWWGQTDYPRERAKMLAELGYTAMAVDMYGGRQIADHPNDAGAFATKVMSDINGAEGRFMAALDILKKESTVDAEKIGAIGYCFGGTVILSMARLTDQLDAAVTFHAGLSIPVPAHNNIHTNILVCNGADDSFNPQELKDKFKAQMDSVSANYRFIDFPGAVHGFSNPGADEYGKKYNIPLAYNSQADLESWDDMKTLFEEVFSK